MKARSKALQKKEKKPKEEGTWSGRPGCDGANSGQGTGRRLSKEEGGESLVILKARKHRGKEAERGMRGSTLKQNRGEKGERREGGRIGTRDPCYTKRQNTAIWTGMDVKEG